MGKLSEPDSSGQVFPEQSQPLVDPVFFAPGAGGLAMEGPILHPVAPATQG